MKRLTFLIVACFIAPQVSFGATLYDFNTSFGSSVTLGYQANLAQLSNPIGGGTNFNSDEFAEWYTLTATSSITMRVKPVSSGSCSPLMGVYFRINGTLTAPNSSTVNGDYCDVAFGTLGTGTTFAGISSVINAYDLYGDTEGMSWLGQSSPPWSYSASGMFGFWLFDSGGITPAVIPDGIQTITSPLGTVASTTVTFSGTFNNGNSHTYDLIAIDTSVDLLNNGTLKDLHGIGIDLATMATSTGNGLAYSQKAEVPYAGHYYYNIFLIDSITGETSTATTSSFIIATSTSLYSPPDVGCTNASALDLLCDLKVGAVWAFYPSQGLVESYINLLDVINTKPPIGYFTIAKNALLGLDASSTPAVTVTIPTGIKDNIFHPLDVGISSIFWFFVLLQFYKRLTTVTI